MRQTLVRYLICTLFLFTAATAVTLEKEFDTNLCFEGGEVDGAPRGWGGGPSETLHYDGKVVHDGQGAARVERDQHSPGKFSSLTKKIPIDFEGEWIELRGYLRAENVETHAGLWMREDGPGGMLQFDNMGGQPVKGTRDWAEYSIRLPLDPNARELLFGVLVSGNGVVWADDLQLLVDGKPIAQAPERVIPPTIIDSDQEFDAGSGISVSELDSGQVELLTTLGRVWGFLKYHHRRVTGGERHWDYELFRILPAMLDAADRDAGNGVLSQWIEELGAPEANRPRAKAPKNTHLLPRLDWIRDRDELGSKLSEQLKKIHKARPADGEQFYLSLAPRVGNPLFKNELAYAGPNPPDAGFRLLALFRLWNIIEYWFPYHDQLDDDWVSVLREFLPRFAAAESEDAYKLELLSLIARIQDTHADLYSAHDVMPPRGECNWPVALRFIGQELTVTRFTHEQGESISELEIGDVIVAVDGKPVDSLIAARSPYYCASNQTRKLHAMARYFTRGDCGESTLDIERRGRSMTVVETRVPDCDLKASVHDRPGEAFQLLAPDLAYLKLSQVRVEDVDDYIERAAGTRGLVIDIRNYPSEFVVFALGSHLVEKSTPFARFTVGDLNNPGAFSWSRPISIEPRSPRYEGKIVVLVDEVSVSQSEYTAMAFRAAPEAIV
ncbi:MAG: hypothetical protein GY946_20140, partial [bacterium]|nr:hypothetical protein [bacterium]